MKRFPPTRVDALLKNWGPMTRAQMDLVYQRIHSAGIDPNDPLAVQIAVGVLLETSLDQRLDEMGKLSDRIGVAACEEYQKFRVIHQSEQREFTRRVTDTVRDTLAEDLPRLAAQHTLRVAGRIGLAVALAVPVLFGSGYWIGGTHAKAGAAEYAAFAARTDAGEWAQLQSANTDLDWLLKQVCVTGQSAYHPPQDGRPAWCLLPLWLEPQEQEPRPSASNWVAIRWARLTSGIQYFLSHSLGS